MNNIYLIGFMGVGKSTVAKELEHSMGVVRVEMDQRIAEEQNMPISEIFERFGEGYFRDLETVLLQSLGQEENLVVSCGGGSVLRDENTKQMKENGCIVLLTADPETIYERVQDSNERPILNGNMNLAYIRELMEKRRSRYDAVADFKVATDGKCAEEICRDIIEGLKERERSGDV